VGGISFEILEQLNPTNSFSPIADCVSGKQMLTIKTVVSLIQRNALHPLLNSLVNLPCDRSIELRGAANYGSSGVSSSLYYTHSIVFL